MKDRLLASLSWRLWLIIAIAVIPPLLLGVFEHHQQRADERIAVQRAVDNVLAAAEGAERVAIRDVETVLRIMANADNMQDLDPNECNGLAARLQAALPIFANLGAAMPDGRVFCSSVSAATSPNVADRQWFIDAFAANGMTTGHFVIGRISGQPGVVFGYPLRDQHGNLRATLFASLGSLWFERLLGTYGLPGGWEAGLVSRDGLILSFFPRSEALQYARVSSDELLDLLQTGGVAELPGLTGEARLLASRPVAFTGGDMSVVVGAPLEQSLSRIDNTHFARIALLLGVAFLSALLARVYIYRLVEQALVRLRGVLARIASGELGTRVHSFSSVTEMATLERGVNDMATQLQRRDAQLHQLAFYDPLTGLANRTLMHDRLNQAVASSARTGRFDMLMMFDVDRFKMLNDTRGHDAGDALLIAIAQRLAQCVRGEDSVARLGDDDFAVLIEDVGDEPGAALLEAERWVHYIEAALTPAYSLAPGIENHVATLSMGVTLFNGREVGAEAAFQQAEVALDRAKRDGRDTVRFFNPEMQLQVEAHTETERQLREALHNKTLQLHYQPQVNLQNQVIGAEALLRWKGEDGRFISPASFIPLAEETGLIIPLGQWVLDEACRQIAAWQANPDTRQRRIAVNISARQFLEPKFVHDVTQSIAAHNIAPSGLELELTESVFLARPEETIQAMQQLRRLGISLSLDDFGTGYSSLSYLKSLPFDRLKVDQSFVRDMLTDDGSAAIVRAIIAMSRSLGLEVIAEGVETDAQRLALKALGCPIYQGYLFGRPAPISEWAE